MVSQESGCESGPVVAGICCVVGVEVAGGASEFSAHRHILEHVELLAQAIHIHHYLFAEACGRRWLAVGLGEHGDIGPFVGSLLESGDELVEQRNERLVQRIAHTHGHRGVVYIL